jgi:transcription elongation factor Elf1
MMNEIIKPNRCKKCNSKAMMIKTEINNNSCYTVICENCRHGIISNSLHKGIDDFNKLYGKEKAVIK